MHNKQQQSAGHELFADRAITFEACTMHIIWRALRFYCIIRRSNQGAPATLYEALQLIHIYIWIRTAYGNARVLFICYWFICTLVISTAKLRQLKGMKATQRSPLLESTKVTHTHGRTQMKYIPRCNCTIVAQLVKVNFRETFNLVNNRLHDAFNVRKFSKLSNVAMIQPLSKNIWCGA